MSIITKPTIIQKQIPANFILNKLNLSNIHIVASDEYFSNINNWKYVIIYYKSTLTKQKEILVFDALEDSPIAKFLISGKAVGSFEVQKIVIQDFDNGTLVIKRNHLDFENIDVTLTEIIQTKWFSLADSTEYITTENSVSNLSNNKINIISTQKFEGNIKLKATFTGGNNLNSKIGFQSIEAQENNSNNSIDFGFLIQTNTSGHRLYTILPINFNSVAKTQAQYPNTIKSDVNKNIILFVGDTLQLVYNKTEDVIKYFVNDVKIKETKMSEVGLSPAIFYSIGMQLNNSTSGFTNIEFSSDITYKQENIFYDYYDNVAMIDQNVKTQRIAVFSPDQEVFIGGVWKKPYGTVHQNFISNELLKQSNRSFFTKSITLYLNRFKFISSSTNDFEFMIEVYKKTGSNSYTKITESNFIRFLDLSSQLLGVSKSFDLKSEIEIQPNEEYRFSFKKKTGTLSNEVGVGIFGTEDSTVYEPSSSSTLGYDCAFTIYGYIKPLT